MPLADGIRLRHMLDAALEALDFCKEKSRFDLDRNRQLALALVKEVEIIGEAATKVSQATRDKIPNLPWQNITGMRNRLVHAYFEINLEILWQTIRKDLPELVTVLKSRLDSGSSQG